MSVTRRFSVELVFSYFSSVMMNVIIAEYPRITTFNNVTNVSATKLSKFQLQDC